METDLFKELYDANPKSESLKNGLAISYEKLGDIHQDLGEVDKALEFFELRTKLAKELYEANPKSVELKDGLAISFYKIGTIYTSENNSESKGYFDKAVGLWKELYDHTKIRKGCNFHFT